MASAGSSKEWMPLAEPVEGVSYPLHIQYCGECGLPPEYCEFGPEPDKCKEWLTTHLPEEFERLHTGDDDGDKDDKDDDKKRQKRGGKAAHKTVQKKQQEKKVCVAKSSRGKRKYCTIITGLGTYDIDIKKAAKFLGGRFACGASVTGEDEIVVQGDFVDDLFGVLPEKWPEIEEETIEDMGEVKRRL